jgi:hypothetical protein
MIKIGYRTENEDVFHEDCNTAPEANESIRLLKESCSGRTDILYFWLSAFDANTNTYQQYGFIDP